MNASTSIRQVFIGFSSFEGWLSAIDRQRPVNAICLVDAHLANGHGLYAVEHLVEVSQVTEHGDVYFARTAVDRYDSPDGVAPLFHEERHADRAPSGWALTQAWLAEQGLQVRQAAVSTPRDLKMLEGSAGFMRFDKDTQRWIRAAAEPVAA